MRALVKTVGGPRQDLTMHQALEAGRRGLPRGDLGHEDEPQLQARLWSNTRRFKAELAGLGFDTGRSETPITPVMMGDPATAMAFADRLMDLSVFAQPVVFPVSPSTRPASAPSSPRPTPTTSSTRRRRR